MMNKLLSDLIFLKAVLKAFNSNNNKKQKIKNLIKMELEDLNTLDLMIVKIKMLNLNNNKI